MGYSVVLGRKLGVAFTSMCEYPVAPGAWKIERGEAVSNIAGLSSC